MNSEQLLAAMRTVVESAAKPKLVNIPGLGKVHVREITIGEIDEQIADTEDEKDKQRTARGATRLLCDENGKQLLDPSNKEHVALMAKMPIGVLTAINKTQEGAVKN